MQKFKDIISELMGESNFVTANNINKMNLPEATGLYCIRVILINFLILYEKHSLTSIVARFEIA